MSVITMDQVVDSARGQISHNLATAVKIAISQASMDWAMSNADFNNVYGRVFRELNNRAFATASAWQQLVDIETDTFAKDVICDLVSGLDKASYTNLADLFGTQERVDAVVADGVAMEVVGLSATATGGLVNSGLYDKYGIGIALVSTGGGAGTWQRVSPRGSNLTTAEYNLGGSWYAANPMFALTAESIDGQSMIKIPQIYVKTGEAPLGSDQAGKTVYWASPYPLNGYHIHPAFYHNGSAVNQFWWGAYKAGVSGGKLTSTPGVACRVSAGQATFEAEAAARNAGGVEGFMLTSYHQLCAIQRLALIEMGTPDAQSAIAAGHTAGSAQVNTDATAELAASWRGLNGLWGNVLQLMVGWQNTAANRLEIWDRLGNRTFVDTGANPNLTAAWRYATTLRTDTGTGYDHSDGFLPSATDAAAGNGTLADGYYGQTGLMSYRHGGDWSDGANAGLFYVYATYAPSHSGTGRGCRLARVI